MIFLFWLTLLIDLFLLVLLIIAISNLSTFRSLKDYVKPARQPFISILVPARNEAEAIGSCVKSLLAQEYPRYEVLVLDDDSSDDTWHILESLSANQTHLKIMKGTPLPSDWLGKHWACHQLAMQAGGDLLLFTDADTIHSPGMLENAAAAMESEGADLISALPQQVMHSFPEKLIMPFSYWSIFCFLPLALAYRSRNPLLSAATGQFMLFNKAAYRQIGGFESIKQHVVDDVELCKRVRSQGMRWRLLDGRGCYRVRQYNSLGELFEGHTKNLFAGFGGNAAVFTAIWLWLLLAFLLPPTSFVTGLVSYGPLNPLLWSGAVGIAISLTTWLIAYVRFGFPAYLALLYPVTITVMTAIAMSSMFVTVSKKATWKGRSIPESNK